MAGEQDVFAGQPLIFSAGLYNDLLEMRREWRTTRHETPISPGPSVSRSDIVQVKNASEVNILRGEVLGFTGYMLTSLNASHFWFNGDEYTDEVGWGISRQPIRIGKIGDCQVNGVCVAWVDVTDANHTHASPASGERYLQSGTSGPCIILHKTSGTGAKECVVLIDRSSGDPPEVGTYFLIQGTTSTGSEVQVGLSSPGAAQGNTTAFTLSSDTITSTVSGLYEFNISAFMTMSGGGAFNQVQGSLYVKLDPDTGSFGEQAISSRIGYQGGTPSLLQASVASKFFMQVEPDYLIRLYVKMASGSGTVVVEDELGSLIIKKA